MTRKEAERLAWQQGVLVGLGFTPDEAERLRRISMALQRWHELECGTDQGCIERDGENGDGKPFMTYETGNGKRGRYAIPDRERGAHKRLAAIMGQRNGRPAIENGRLNAAPSIGKLSSYVQTDPRGAALYILRPGDVPEGADVSAYYSRGICVY
jgi:hypothetical protein